MTRAELQISFTTGILARFAKTTKSVSVSDLQPGRYSLMIRGTASGKSLLAAATKIAAPLGYDIEWGDKDGPYVYLTILAKEAVQVLPTTV